MAQQPKQRPRKLIATYHYVRPENSDGVTGITPEEFEKQLRRIRDQYQVVDADEFEGREEDPEARIALITFDDAVLDQYQYAAPILDRLGMSAVFFAPMRPFACFDDRHDPGPEARDRRWITQHLLHALAQFLGWSDLEQRVQGSLRSRQLQCRIDEQEMQRLYHYEVPHKRRLKYTLAFALDADTARSVLLEINRETRLDAGDWFMSRAQLQDLECRGFCIGGHGFDHLPYSTLTAEQQRIDLERSRQTLDEFLEVRARPLAYPFGRSTEATESLAHEFGFTRCYGTTERVDAKDVLSVLDAAADCRDATPHAATTH